MLSSDLLSVTIALTLTSFLATLYVIIRTLTPLVGPHILSRYARKTNPIPVYGYASPTPEKIKLRSAQRFQCWLALVDLLSCGVWLWEVVSLAGGAASSPARMAFAICARPTILLVVSLLSYLNVIRGKVIDLGKFDFIVWIPSVVLLTIMVSLAYVSHTTSSTVWQVLMAVETVLLSICTFCFGRLLLAVYRVRRATLRTHGIRHRMAMEEKAAKQERFAQLQQEEEEARRAREEEEANAPPILPPLKTNRWLISKTFLLAKASSAANTVHTSLHRRSQSGAATLAGRPSTTSATDLPRISFSSHGHGNNEAGDSNDNRDNGPYSFLNHDPARTTRFGHFRAQSNSQAESQTNTHANTHANHHHQQHSALTAPPLSPSPAPTPRAVSFDLDTAARPNSPAPPLSEVRLGAMSRMTDFSRISIDQPRPSMGSYMSDAGTSESGGGVAGYLSGSRLAERGRFVALSKGEAKKAGARMGGHLLGCVASWTLILPFLVYKIHQPASPAPFYSTILVAMGLSLSGPLLAFQTMLAEGGFWYRKSVPPLMASSSAVAFEHLNSRTNTPAPALQPPHSATFTQPNSANTDITQATAQSAATIATNASSHRSNSSTGSTSSLASMAAFGHPAPGTFRHSLDTQDAPSGMFARALAMAAPHPKLQIIKAKGVRDSHNIENIDIENVAQIDEEDLRKREARKLKSFSMSKGSISSQRERRRSNTVGTLENSWDDLEKAEIGHRIPHRRSALSMKDANSLTTAMLAEKKRPPSRSPSVSSFTFRSSRGTSLQERRRSAPITPLSRTTQNESGVLVPRPGDGDYNIDSLTASLLQNMLPGMRISTSTVSSKRTSLHKSKNREMSSISPESTFTATSSMRKKRPNLSLDIAAKDSSFSKVAEASRSIDVSQGGLQDSPSLAIASSSNYSHNVTDRQSKRTQHLRRRSRKSISYAVADEALEGPLFGIDDKHITTRRVVSKPRLSPAAETSEKEDNDQSPAGLRPSLEAPLYHQQTSPYAATERVEVLSEHQRLPLDVEDPISDAKNAQSGELSRPSIIIRTKASVTSQDDAQDGQEELGTVATATRIHRTPSRSSFGSDYNLRPLSMASSDDNVAANRSRSSTLGSITSEGFRNMIQSNRNSWTGSDVGNESISAMLDRHGALAEAATSTILQPLQARDRNMSIDKQSSDLEKEKAKIGTALASPTSPSPTIRAGAFVSPQRVQLSDLRSTRQPAGNDENVPPSPTGPSVGPGRPMNTEVSRYGSRIPRLHPQRSVLSLR